MKIFLEFSVNLLMALMGFAHKDRVFTQVTMTTRLFPQYLLNVFFVVNKSILAGKCFFLQPSGQVSRTDITIHPSYKIVLPFLSFVPSNPGGAVHADL